MPDSLRLQKQGLIQLGLRILLGLAVFISLDRGVDLVLRQGIDRYFGLNTPETVLLVGHSHVVLGLDNLALEQALGVPVSKYARAGAKLEDRILMARHYAALHPEGPRAIIFGVDGHLFSARGLSSNAHKLFYPHMDNPVVSAYLREKALNREEYWSRRLIKLARYNDVLLNAARRGLMGNWSNGVGGRFDVERLQQQTELGNIRRIETNPIQVAALEAFLAEAEAKGWPVILTFVPTTKAWNDLEPEKFAAVQSLLASYPGQFRGVHYLDLTDPWSTQYDLFADPIHLNHKGQRLVTADLADRMQTLLQTFP